MATKKVLLVEDDVAFQQLVKLALGGQDCDFDVTMTGRKALQLMQKNSYDLIICDYRLPKMHGLDVLQAARSMNDACKCVLVSATPRDALETEIRKAKVSGFLQKPASPSEILKEIRKAL